MFFLGKDENMIKYWEKTMNFSIFWTPIYVSFPFCPQSNFFKPRIYIYDTDHQTKFNELKEMYFYVKVIPRVWFLYAALE